MIVCDWMLMTALACLASIALGVGLGAEIERSRH